MGIIWIIVVIVALVAAFFMPKWLFWITPRAYSVHDVLSEQYGSRTSFLIIALTAAVIGGLYFLLVWGSEHGW